jgi:hypothetical protein
MTVYTFENIMDITTEKESKTLLANMLTKEDYYSDNNIGIVINDFNEFYRIYTSEDGWMYDIFDLDDVKDLIKDNSISEFDLDDLDIVDGGVFETDILNFESAYQAVKFIFQEQGSLYVI